jgi:hypothetical protein
VSKSLWNNPGILKYLAASYWKIPEGLISCYTGPSGTKEQGLLVQEITQK